MEVVVEDFLPAAAEEDYLEMAEDSLVTAADFLALQAKVLEEAKASVEETHLEKQQKVSPTDSSHLEQVLSEVPTVTLLFRVIIVRTMAK
jgi:hypothetical protein